MTENKYYRFIFDAIFIITHKLNLVGGLNSILNVYEREQNLTCYAFIFSQNFFGKKTAFFFIEFIFRLIDFMFFYLNKMKPEKI